jgi:hypothetical protein
MESKLTLANILSAYKAYKQDRDNMGPWSSGRYLGYLEAGLQVYGCQETVKNQDPKSKFYGQSEVKREVIKNKKWWKKDKPETMEQAIIRQVENMFTKNNIKF